MREQIRLWFYSQLFMSVALVGKAPFKSALGYEKMLDEHGREMHGSWGNLIPAEDAFSRMGADVMRWQFCTQPPDRNLLFGYGPAHEIKRRLLTLWNSVRFLCDYGNIEGFEPRYADLSGLEDVELTLLDRWLARAHRRARRRDDRGVRGAAFVPRRRGVRGVRRRSLELVHPPLAPAVLRLRRRGVSHALDRTSCSPCA